MARRRRAEAQQILPAKLVERAQQVMLVAQPASVFGDDRRTIAVDANPERIAPLAAAPDVDVAVVPASRVFVENPAHLNPHFPLRERRRPEGRGAEPARHASGRLDHRRGNGSAVDIRATTPNWPTLSDERDRGWSAGFPGTSSPGQSRGGNQRS